MASPGSTPVTPAKLGRQRSRSEHRRDDADYSPPLTKDDTESLVRTIMGEWKEGNDRAQRDFQEEMRKHIDDASKQRDQDAAANLEASFTNVFARMAATDRANEKKFEHLYAELEATKQVQNKTISKQEETRALTESFVSRVQLAETTSVVAAATAAEDIEFDRPALPNVIRCNITEEATKDALQDSISQLLTDANICVDHAILTGPKSGKYFTLTFAGNGNADTRIRRANTLFEYIRGDGTWRNVSCESVAGTATKVYLVKDQAPRQRRLEVSSKRLYKILQKQYPSATLTWGRRDGWVYHEGKPLARTVVVSSDIARVEWNPSVATAASIDREMAVEKWEKRPVEAVPWEV